MKRGEKLFSEKQFWNRKKVRNIFNESFSKKVFSVNNDLGNMKREKSGSQETLKY